MFSQEPMEVRTGIGAGPKDQSVRRGEQAVVALLKGGDGEISVERLDKEADPDLDAYLVEGVIPLNGPAVRPRMTPMGKGLDVSDRGVVCRDRRPRISEDDQDTVSVWERSFEGSMGGPFS